MLFLTDSWFDAVNSALAEGPVHRGIAATADVIVKGGPDGKVTFHLCAEHGGPIRFGSGPAGAATVTLDQAWADAVAQFSGSQDPAVAFMRGDLKVKGSARPLLELFRTQADPTYRACLEPVVAETVFG